MTTTERIIVLLQAGRMMTAREMSKELGVDIEQVRNVIKGMIRTDLAVSKVQETQYLLTKKGEEKTPVVRTQRQLEHVRRQTMRRRALKVEQEARKMVNKKISQDMAKERIERAQNKAAFRAVQNAKAGKVANSVFNWR